MQSWMDRPAPAPAPAHRLRPLEGGPWLFCHVWNPSTCMRMLGWLGGSLALLALVPLSTVLGLALLVSAALAGLGCIGLTGWALDAHQYQYCPECLSAMHRGAHVCPFCHFRPPTPDNHHAV